MSWLDDLEQQMAHSKEQRRKKVLEHARSIDPLIRTNLSDLGRKAFGPGFRLYGPDIASQGGGELEWVVESLDQESRYLYRDKRANLFYRDCIGYDESAKPIHVVIYSSGRTNSAYAKTFPTPGVVDEATLREAIADAYFRWPAC